MLKYQKLKSIYEKVIWWFCCRCC